MDVQDLSLLKQLNAIKNVFLVETQTEENPEFLVVTGSIGVGKTTFRKEQVKNFVHIDYADILPIVKETFEEFEELHNDYTLMIMVMLIQDALFQRKNIAIEILGNDSEALLQINDAMKKYGYTTSLKHLECPDDVAIQRHEKALEEDEDYLSAYYTQDSIISLLYIQLGIGDYVLESENKG